MLRGKTILGALYSAIAREMLKKGGAARFMKAGKGKFTLRGKSGLTRQG